MPGSGGISWLVPINGTQASGCDDGVGWAWAPGAATAAAISTATAAAHEVKAERRRIKNSYLPPSMAVRA
ncbi:hypothetical protein GCM10010528_16520 [Gordonia defluvii]|uniref:Uncharacterized protein n=1 Tax=Gordonia defluvii TaxID=283718 RepID=A0ABP6LEB4_9ACTN